MHIYNDSLETPGIWVGSFNAFIIYSVPGSKRLLCGNKLASREGYENSLLQFFAKTSMKVI